MSQDFSSVSGIRSRYWCFSVSTTVFANFLHFSTLSWICSRRDVRFITFQSTNQYRNQWSVFLILFQYASNFFPVSCMYCQYYLEFIKGASVRHMGSSFSFNQNTSIAEVDAVPLCSLNLKLKLAYLNFFA